MARLGSMNEIFLSHWNDLAAKVKGQSPNQSLNGRNLDLATVIAIARHGASVSLSESSLESVVKSAEMVQASIDRGEVVYGVNTGFGGSADTRTAGVEELQKNLLRMLQFGVTSDNRPVIRDAEAQHDQDLSQIISQSALPLDDPVAATSMPESWVRASMLIRLNSLASGVSGVKADTIKTFLQVLDAGITPQIPIKGSISASGDLSPLAYIGGLIQGKPAINAWTRDADGNRCLKRADVALAEKSIKPVTLAAKEGLALVNGTAISAGVGSLALHDAFGQAALSQVLTALSVEALCGTDESFDPFFGEVRAHPGQIETAHNIHAFLSKSSFVQHSDNAEEGELRQDRYSVRTASQWIGPVLEDLNLAHQQLTIELNSTTDNPLINPKQDGKMMHGGNFQARAVTSAMEKARQALQTIGRMLFAQCTELINPATNHGLPPNLVGGEPSQSFIWKGTDIMIAALQAELGFLANPVGSHVQTAEMGNQAINSLALISGRYTLEAVQTLSQLSAAHLVAACQALDIRAMNYRFLETLAPVFKEMVEDAFGAYLQEGQTVEALQASLWTAFRKSLDAHTNFDSPKRFSTAADSLQHLALKAIVASEDAVNSLKSWTETCSAKSLEMFRMNRVAYFENPDATPYLGSAACRMYRFLREHLDVPFIGNEHITTPRQDRDGFNWGQEGAEQDASKGTTMGKMIAKVFDSMRSGAIYPVVIDCIADVHPDSTHIEEKLAEISKARDASAELKEGILNRKEFTPADSEESSDYEGKELFTPARRLSSGATTAIDPNEDYQVQSLGKEHMKEVLAGTAEVPPPGGDGTKKLGDEGLREQKIVEA